MRHVPLKQHDSVVLLEDLPEHGLRAGDAGVVVHRYSASDVEVEFVRLSGHTQAVLTLPTRVVRLATDNDIMTVRDRG